MNNVTSTTTNSDDERVTTLNRPIQTSTLAVISLIFGILSYFGLIVIGPIITIITANQAKSDIKNSHDRLKGGNIISWALNLAYFNLGISILIFLWFFVGQLKF